MEVPTIVRRFYSHFPLVTYDDESVKSTPSHPTLWIAPPRTTADADGDSGALKSPLSSDIECLKWQTYLALRLHTPPHDVRVKLRWDVQRDGGVNDVLPSLHLPEGDLLGIGRIPGWADKTLNAPLDELEGYASAEARDESRAWVTLFEGVVHSALVIAQRPSFSISSWLDSTFDISTAPSTIASFFQPPLPPLTGLSTVVPPTGIHIPVDAVNERYREAVQAVSDRLGNDRWLLGSSSPTPLDAIMFAYLHHALSSSDKFIRNQVSSRQNLVVWERRVLTMVDQAYADSN